MKRFRFVPLALSLLLCIGVLSQVRDARAQEVPVTTDSEEARKAFEEGMKLTDNLRGPEARVHFDKAIAADPDFALAHLFRALAGDSQMDYLEHLGHATKLAENASEGERLLIQSYQAQADGKSERRRELLKQLAEKYPEDRRVAFLYAVVQEKAADRAKQLQKVTELDSEYAPAYNVLGYAYRDMGDYEKAEQAFQTYVSLIPEEPNPYDSMADLYMKMGRYEDAIANYEKALERSPKFTISQQKIGVSHDFMGRHEEARKAYAKQAKMEETPAGKINATLAASDSYLYEGNYEKALAKVDKAIKMAEEAGLTPMATWTKLRKSWIALNEGKLDEAEKYLAEARAYAKEHDLPEQVQNNFENYALWDEAVLAAKKGNREAAHKHAQAFKARVDKQVGSADEQMYHDLAGHLYLSEGDHKKAAKHFRQADQEDPYVLYHLALVEEKEGNREKAAELMKKAADWNEGSLEYALIRPKAQEWMRGQAVSENE